MKYFSIVFIVLWRVCNVPEVVAKNRNLMSGNELFGSFPWNALAETVQNGLDCFRDFVPSSELKPNYNIKRSRIKLGTGGLKINSALHSNSTLIILGMFTAGSITFCEAKQKYLKIQQVKC